MVLEHVQAMMQSGVNDDVTGAFVSILEQIMQWKFSTGHVFRYVFLHGFMLLNLHLNSYYVYM
jgi:hypothetical protein